MIEPITPLGWQTAPLSAIARQVKRRVKVLDDDVYPLLGMRWYAAGPFVKKEAPGRSLKAKYLYQVQQADFIYNRLFGWKGSFGFIKPVHDGCYVSGEFPTFIVDERLAIPEFLWRYFSLPQIWQAIGEASSGSTQTSRLRFKEADFLQLQVPLPPLTEQRAIADVLHTIQQVAESTDRAISAAKELKRSLAQDLLTASAMPGAPFLKIKDVVLQTRTDNPTKRPDQEFWYVDVSAISAESLTIENPRCLLGPEAPSRARKQISTGDTIFATVRPSLKRVARVPKTLDGQICSTAFAVLRPDPSAIDPEYLFQVASSENFVERVSQHQRGSSYPAVRDHDVLNEGIPVPPLVEQRHRAAVLKAVDLKILAETNRSSALQTVFTSLLHEVMTGQTRVIGFESPAA